MLRLSKMLRHRGPDWNGIHSFRNCILAHERLSINGLHSGTAVAIFDVLLKYYSTYISKIYINSSILY